jgi:hypothetical protein
VFKCSIASIAATHNTDSRALEEDLYAEHLGSPFQAFGEVIAGIHERFQQDAEAAAEMGYGSRLGNKLMNPFNYCALGLRSADPVTRDILAETTVINDEVAQIYFAFLRMIDKIDAERESRGVEAEQVSNYTLGLSVRFMGAGMSELGKRWAEGIGAALQKFFEERSAPPMPE